jgi:hypothetical protein
MGSTFFGGSVRSSLGFGSPFFSEGAADAAGAGSFFELFEHAGLISAAKSQIRFIDASPNQDGFRCEPVKASHPNAFKIRINCTKGNLR